MRLNTIASITLAAAAAMLATGARAATEQNQASSAIMLQGFHWNSWKTGTWYTNLGGKAADMKDLGVTHVWFPPPSDSAATEGYLPRQLNLLNSSYGTEAQLTSVISQLKAQGIHSIADVVINHRVGTANWADFTNPAWDCKSVVNNDEWTGKCGNADSGDSYGAARDIDHSYLLVQNDIKTWLSSRLKGVGFTGIRYDYSKGYAPSYAKTYHDAMAPNFCVGEIWTDLNYANVDAHRQLLVNYVDGTAGQCAAFDFTTKGLLNQALGSNEYWRLKDGAGKPAGGIGWWAQKMVTFVDNHDTGPSESAGVGQNHWPVPSGKVMEGYAYVLTHPGIPTVYYPHVYDWGMRASIKALIGVRKAMGVTSTSAVTINAAQAGLYAATITGSAGQVAMKIGGTDWNPGAGWTLATSGSGYAVWTKSSVADTAAPSTPTGLSASGITSTSVNLAWAAATDNVGVTGYKVFRNGTQVATVTGTSYAATGLTAATAYSFTVRAHDAAGNTSAASAALNVTTAGSGGGTCSANVTFSIANANTAAGQSLRVVGNVAALGAWAPASGFGLTIQGSGVNATWRGTRALPCGTAVQYKYVKWNGSTAVWESNQATASGNRQFTTPTAGGAVTRADGNFKF